MKKKLIDSNQHIQNISVVIICKNNENWLHFVLNMFQLFVQTYEVKFTFYFFENDSIDATPALIRGFLYEYNGLYINVGNSKLLNQLSRVERITHIRNISKDIMTNKCGDWMLLIDSDIYFDVDILEKLFRNNPTENKIGMLCAFGIAAKREGPNFDVWVTNNHYYDTAAFLADVKSPSAWPYCQFEGCRECEARRELKGICTSGTVDVHSAFGGLALIKKEIISNVEIKWKSKSVNNSPFNEHIDFCELIQTLGKLKISVATDVPVLWDISTLNITS